MTTKTILEYTMPNNGGSYKVTQSDVLTKREMFCLHHGVADTGDSDLDEIIRKGNRQKAAMAAMQGILANSGGVIQANGYNGSGWVNSSEHSTAEMAVSCADALIAELEQQS